MGHWFGSGGARQRGEAVSVHLTLALDVYTHSLVAFRLTLTSDTSVEVQRVLGCNILPVRVLRPTDEQAVERAFGAIRSLLFELPVGYQGIDVVDRGTDPEADAVLTMTAMERQALPLARSLHNADSIFGEGLDVGNEVKRGPA